MVISNSKLQQGRLSSPGFSSFMRTDGGRGTYSGVAWVILMCSTVTLDRFTTMDTMASILNVS